MFGFKVKSFGCWGVGLYSLEPRGWDFEFTVWGIRKGLEFRVRGSVHSAEGGGVGGFAMVSIGVRMEISNQVEEWE